MNQKGRSMDSAPKDGTPILALCNHEADPYFEEDGVHLTLYGAHTEGFSHVINGKHVIQWGGAYDESTWENSDGEHLPDWWFLFGSDFEITANPIRWWPLPDDEEEKTNLKTTPTAKDAADWLEARRDAFVQEHGSYDPSTGVTELSILKQDLVSEWDEIIEGIRSLPKK